VNLVGQPCSGRRNGSIARSLALIPANHITQRGIVYINQYNSILLPKKICLAMHPQIMTHRIPITRARIIPGRVARRVHINKEDFILEKYATR
jgi:hypothetical protein